MSLYQELKRRNVFRVAIAYLAGAWLLTEVAGTLFPAFGIPDWGVRFVVVILLLGFLPAVIFSWVYEMTPEGLKREKDIVREASITHLTAKRLDGITIGLIAVALVFIVVDRIWLARTIDRAPDVAVEISVENQALGTGPDESEYPPNTIAVLPFVNMSDDEGNEYFSDGISEELLNLLVKIPELRVIARTSSFAFKGKDMTISDMANELRAGHILEGSVRKDGNQVRITAQLIRTDDSTHLWSETYDRTLDNIFAIQDEIAATVVDQLKITLLGETPRSQIIDPEAYALFLQARHLDDMGTASGLEQAAGLLQQALAIAPGYSPAWSELGRNWQNKVAARLVDRELGLLKSEECKNQALALDPENAVALSRHGFDTLHYEADLPAAARYFEQALALEPGNAIVLANASSLAMTLGRINQAIVLRELAQKLDPLSPVGASGLGWSYLMNNQLDEAERELRRALSLSPGSFGDRAILARILFHKNDPGYHDEIRRLIAEEPLEPLRLGATVALHYQLGETAESDAALETLIEKYHTVVEVFIALVYAIRGETDTAFEWLEQAVASKGPQALYTRWYMPEFRVLHDDPRWEALLMRVGLSRQQLAEIHFEFELPD